MLNSLFDSLARYFQRKSSYKTLNALSDNELKDIGIDRSQIPYIVNNPNKFR
jgi:uncharacterized protein YjiS (DUF1127 family)